jgi:hypothetical protein
MYLITRERLRNLDEFYQKVFEVLIERGDVEVADDRKIPDTPS